MTRTLAQTVARNSVVGLAAQVAIKALSLTFSILIVRNLGAETYGQYAAVLAFGALFVFLADLGLAPYVVREIARRRDTPDGRADIESLYTNMLALRIVLAVVTGIVIIASAWLTGRPLVMIVAIALNALGLIMYGAQGSSEALLGGFERVDVPARAKAFAQLAFVVLGAVALWATIGYYGLIFANLVSIALLTWLCWRAARRLGLRRGQIAARTWPALLRSGLPFAVIGLALGLSYKFDSVLLNVTRGDAETGYYTAMYNLIFSAVLISNVLNTALYPSLARQAATALQRLPHIYERTLRYLMVIAFPIAVGAWALADQIVPFLYKDGYAPAVPALQVLIWVVPLMYASEFLGYAVVIGGQERKVMRSVLISSGFNVALNLMLVPRYGFVAAAVMTVLTEAVLVGQYVWLLRSTLRQMRWSVTLLRPLLAALLMLAVVLALRSQLSLPANVAIAAIVYGGCLIALRVIGPDEVRFVRSMRSSSEATIAQ